MASHVIVRAIDVRKRYGKGDAEIWALNGVSCQIESGEYVSIVGPSGSGKSTLFNLIGGLDVPTSGNVFVESVDIGQLPAAELAHLRSQRIGYIFQTFNLIGVRTALENVALPMLIAGDSPEDADQRAIQLLDKVGLGHRLHHRPQELSGGQQQRVAVARALANNPAIVLADEPTGNLDQSTGREIVGLLRQLCDEDGVTVISATHDPKMIDVSDRTLMIQDGQLVTS